MSETQSFPLPRLSDNRDVSLTSPVNHNVLAYDAGSSQWTNQTAGGAGLALASHTHTSSQITDWTSAVEAVVAGMGIGGSGVTSVALTAASLFVVTGSPITSSGTLDLALAVQPANMILAGPATGADAAPTFRALVAADIPTLAHSSLSGLTSGDPHTQYAKADGSRGTFGGWQWLSPAVCAATGNVDIAGGGLANGTVHDGQTVSTGWRVMLPNQTNALERGLYIVPASGAAARAPDLPVGAMADNCVITISRGALYHDQTLHQTGNGCTVGTDAQTWQTFPRDMVGDSGSGGASGCVPAPVAGDAALQKFLGANGGWIQITDLSLAAVKVGVTYQTFNTLTDGATITIDWSLRNRHTVTLGGNRTLAFSNTTAGQGLRLRLKQDGTGGRSVTWPSGISWAGGTAPSLTTTANKTDEVIIQCETAGSAYTGYLVATNI